MNLRGDVKNVVNRMLRPMNLRIESCTADRTETARLQALSQSGHFAGQISQVPEQFLRSNPLPVFDAVRKYAPRLEQWILEGGPQQYSLDNDYYSSPDAEVLYAMVRLHQPKTIVEVGSGNSTLLFRQAIADGALTTRLISIDPAPRREITRYADELIPQPVESLDQSFITSRLQWNDFLFIDSSHEIKTGNDVLHLYLRILPSLSPGVIVHMHDIFLPFEYPKEWIVERRWPWAEQYLLQALLYGSDRFEVLWAGHYLQRTMPHFHNSFRLWRGANATSAWLRHNPAAQ